MRYLDTGTRDPEQTLAKWLESVLSEDVTELRVQSGFFSLNGIGLFLPILETSLKEDRVARILVGSNDGCTTREDVEGLIELLGIPRSHAQLGIISFAGGYFHPKTYHVRRPDGTEAAFVGSANLTPSGLARHVEAGLALDTREGDPNEVVSQIAAAIDHWFEHKQAGFELVEGSGALDGFVQSGLLALAPPPQSSKSGGGSTKNSRPHLWTMVALPSLKGKKVLPAAETVLIPESLEAAPEEGGIPLVPTAKPLVAANTVPSAPKPGFPQYLLFDTSTDQPTAAALALTGSQLPSGATGLIIQLNKDSARHFMGKGGTANISMPVATLGTLRFGLYGKHNRPRAEYELRLRYTGDSGTLAGGSVETNVMGYGFTENESGNSDVRMLVPHEVVKLGEAVEAMNMALPTVGDLALLEWPTPETPSFGLTFLQGGSAIDKNVTAKFNEATKAGQLVGKGACWLPANLSPAW